MSDPSLLKAADVGVPTEDLEFLARNYGSSYGVEARSDIAASCEPSNSLHILLEGWACKYRLMADGRRQIISVLLPGDACDLERLFNGDRCVGVTALTDCRIATLASAWLDDARKTRPAIREMLWRLVAGEHAAMTEQIVVMGRRTSRQRVAFLLCNLFERLQALGLTDKGSFWTPLTQSDLADALGLSTVHINRTLQGLREDRLIEMRGRSLRVPLHAALRRAAGYEHTTSATAA